MDLSNQLHLTKQDIIDARKIDLTEKNQIKDTVKVNKEIFDKFK
jgi:hypothetical protein